MDVWVVSVRNLADESLKVEVFANETIANTRALQIALEQIDAVEGNQSDYYKDIVDAMRKNKFNKAFELFDDWIASQYYDETSGIDVHECSLDGMKPVNEDKPCKQCGKMVNKTDSVCWWCSVLNPGK